MQLFKFIQIYTQLLSLIIHKCYYRIRLMNFMYDFNSLSVSKILNENLIFTFFPEQNYYLVKINQCKSKSISAFFTTLYNIFYYTKNSINRKKVADKYIFYKK
jgi:hypothetical protein